jgi:hypothetical protein
MSGPISEVSTRQAARIAGLGILIIAVLSIFANFFVLEKLVKPGDSAATTANVIGSEGLFRSGLAAFMVVIVLDAVIAWALYIFFRPLKRDLSLLTALFRLVYAAIFGVALINLFSVLQIVSGAGYSTAFETDQLNAQVMQALDAFNYGWLIGLVFFGLHLFFLGRLVQKSRSIPSLLGVLLMLAGAAYVIDTFANALMANYDDYETVFLIVVAVPAVIGELAIAFWLLLRGGKAQRALQEGG